VTAQDGVISALKGPVRVTSRTLSSHQTQESHRAGAHPALTPERARAALGARRILQLNALTGMVSGPALVLGAGFIAPLLGIERYTAAVPVLQATGVGLVSFAALLLWIARRPVPPAPATMLAIGLIDALWVAASAALLLSRFLPLSAAGVWIVAIQADVIALLAALELRAWWQTR